MQEHEGSKWTKLGITIDFKLDTELTRTVLIEKYNVEKVKLAEMRWFFLSKIDGCELFEHDNYSYVFYIKNDEILMERDDKNKCFYIKYNNFWSVFESQYRCNYTEIQSFTRDILETPLKHQGYKTRCRGARSQNRLETPLKHQGYKTF